MGREKVILTRHPRKETKPIAKGSLPESLKLALKTSIDWKGNSFQEEIKGPQSPRQIHNTVGK